MKRRGVLQGVGASVAALSAAKAARAAGVLTDAGLPEGTRASATLEALPGKNKLVKLTYRPPNYETPVGVFRTPITANADFFVRYHLGEIPDLAALKDWKLSIGGDAAEKPVSFSLNDLKSRFPIVEATAVCQCSGNRRGFSEPHVPGVQWGSGAMGNARWTGVRLKDVLAAAGVKAGALEVAFDGADKPVIEATPDFIKSIPLAMAQSPDVLLAWNMNGVALPLLNGFPLRVVVPGWTATYWVKHLTTIDVRSKPSENFWMQKAYRVPKNMFPPELAFTTQEDANTAPITDIVVNSLIAAPAPGARVAQGGFDVQGVAWDGGSGIKSVEVSADGGKTWKAASLGQDLGRFAFRTFSLRVTGAAAGEATILARAVSQRGEAQADKLKFNPAGYHNNVPRAVSVTVA